MKPETQPDIAIGYVLFRRGKMFCGFRLRRNGKPQALWSKDLDDAVRFVGWTDAHNTSFGLRVKYVQIRHVYVPSTKSGGIM